MNRAQQGIRKRGNDLLASFLKARSTQREPTLMADFVPQTIAELQRDFAEGLSPVAVIEACLARIEKTNSLHKAMIFVGREEALEEARQAEAELRAGKRRGSLQGVPVAVKDVIDVRGWPTTSGSKLFDGHVAENDAACVANLRAAGAIIIGKTNLHELTAGGHDNPWFGKVVNPLDHSRGTGGTSSGSAAAVAAGFCVAAIGTDSGGSNRSPAAATGLVGLKPTNGAIDHAGVRPTAPSFDTIGPIATCVEDARLVHFAMQGGAVPASRDVGPQGLVVGLFSDLHDAEVDVTVALAHDAWLGSLSDVGATIHTLKFPLSAEVREAGGTILAYEFASQYGRLVERRPESVGEAVVDFVSNGLSIDESTYRSALAFRVRVRDEFLKLMSTVDVLAAPVAPGLAPRLTDEMTQVGSGFVPYGLAGGSFRRWANFFGIPALAMPLPSEDRLPASIQISTMPDTEPALFSICAALQRSRADGAAKS
jgi:aspartyl-tRNA(Asn)/glutamyl-tRNA(Gln) amidotransferase subunit A